SDEGSSLGALSFLQEAINRTCRYTLNYNQYVSGIKYQIRFVINKLEDITLPIKLANQGRIGDYT
ncbi:MAG: hypothetical protein ACTSSD_16135, partial [Candidatus Thorarchaeota archaeon]